MYLFILKRLLKNSTLHRAMLDYRLRSVYLSGDTLDLGAGKDDRYSQFIPRSNRAAYFLADNKLNKQAIDFETDKLPYKTNEFETVLFFNVLEHLYKCQNVLTEIRRIKHGQLIGFVPFLKWVHPDPNDYFRYTDQALEKIFRESGYEDIRIETFAIGPYCSAFEEVRPTLPIFLRPLIFSLCYPMDLLFQKLRGKNYKRYALGYFFICR